MARFGRTIPQWTAALLVSLATSVPPCTLANDTISNSSNWPFGSRFETNNFRERTAGPKKVFPKNAATIQDVRTKHRKTIENYSDGLVVEIDRNGNRKETLKSKNWALEARVPSDYGKKSSVAVDGFVRALIDLASVHGRCSSRLQSRLYQFGNYYLSVKEPEKAAPLIRRYLEINREIHDNGTPLSDAEKTYLTALETASAKNHLFDSRLSPEQ